VLLVIPLIMMTLLYGSVIRTLRMGIKMDIAAIEGDGVKAAMSSSLYCKSNGRQQNGTCSTRRSTVARKLRVPWTSEKLKSGRLLSSTSSSPMPSTASTHPKGNAVALMEQSVRSTHSEKVAVAKQRLVRMLIVIVIIFFLCWTPSYIWWLILNAQDWGGFGSFNVWNSELNTFITVLTYISSCTNPITYCFLNSKFRNALFLSFGCRGKTNAQRIYFQRPHKRSDANNNSEHHSDAKKLSVMELNGPVRSKSSDLSRSQKDYLQSSTDSRQRLHSLQSDRKVEGQRLLSVDVGRLANGLSDNG